MSKEYIEREAVANAVKKWLGMAKCPYITGSYNQGEIAAYETALDEIITIPAADVVEVRHGRWIKIEGLSSDYCCSECNKQWWTPFPEEMHYCPNCGAKMDGERKGGDGDGK